MKNDYQPDFLIIYSIFGRIHWLVEKKSVTRGNQEMRRKIYQSENCKYSTINAYEIHNLNNSLITLEEMLLTVTICDG